jgi:hypothetical protein
MEYKPPFDNHSGNNKYRFLYCALNPLDEWTCVRCEDEEKCYSSPSLCQSKKSRVIKISQDVPEYLDRIIVMSKLSSSKIEMKK